MRKRLFSALLVISFLEVLLSLSSPLYAGLVDTSCNPGSNHDYQVGPGQIYQNIGDVPWKQLQPGDSVRVYYRADPYHEKLTFTGDTRGTKDAPILICGVLGPNGERPIIDGQNATSSPNFNYISYLPVEAIGGVSFYLSDTQVWGSTTAIAEYYIFRNFEVRNFSAPYTFTSSTGGVVAYNRAAGINGNKWANIEIGNCFVHDNNEGIFGGTADNGLNSWALSHDIRVVGNYIYHNGTPMSYRDHGSYIEAKTVTYEYNRYGPQRDGAGGEALKDRSDGVVIRHNYFDNEGATTPRFIDMVDPQESYNSALSDPNFGTAYVYGNILVARGPNAPSQLMQFGGDDGAFEVYQKKIYLYNNTFVVSDDSSDNWRTTLLWLSTNSQTADIRNNIIFFAAETSGALPTKFELLGENGSANFGVNWVSPGWLPSRDGFPFTGTITGTNSFVSNTTNNPGFVNLPLDIHLVSGSQAIDLSGPLASGVTSSLAILNQYVYHQDGQLRPVVGTALDLGAFEFAGNSAPRIAQQPANQSVTAGQQATFSVVAAGNPAPAYQWQTSKDNGTTWSNISGATSAGYTTPVLALTDNYAQYHCVANNSQGAVTSSPAVLSVVSNGGAPSKVALDNLNSVKVYPNPFRSSQGHTAITFTNMPAGTRLRFYTSAGEKVKELNADSTGTAVWDGSSDAGRHMASGVYFGVLEGNGQKKILNVAIQR